MLNVEWNEPRAKERTPEIGKPSYGAASLGDEDGPRVRLAVSVQRSDQRSRSELAMGFQVTHDSQVGNVRQPLLQHTHRLLGIVRSIARESDKACLR